MNSDSKQEKVAWPRAQVDSACRSSAVDKLKNIFAQLEVHPDHDRRPKEQRPPVGSVNGMLLMAKDQPEVCEFLGSYFDKCKIEPCTVGIAISHGNVEMLRAIRKLDPTSLHETPGGTTFGQVCSSNHDPSLKAEMVKEILRSGADPNLVGGRFPFPADWYVITCGLPPATMQDLFDAGYRMNWENIKEIIKHKRAWILEVVYNNGMVQYADLQNSPLPGPQELMKMCKATKDQGMIAMVGHLFPKESFPAESGKRKWFSPAWKK